MPYNHMECDWRKRTDYPGERASPQEFAWEFLRRNEEYRADWRKYRALLSRHRIGKFDLIGFDPPLREGETKSQWWLRAGNASAIRGQRRWHIQELTDPDLAYSEMRASFLDDPNSVRLADQYKFSPEHWHKRAIVVDLRLPINEYLKKVAKVLQPIQRRLVTSGKLALVKQLRGRQREWVRYLRVADATRAGAGDAEIRRALQITAFQLRDSRNKANDLMRFGYRDLAA